MACFHKIPAWRSRQLSGERRFGITLKKQEAWTDLPVDLPCGKCVGCRLERAQQWGTRVMNELRYHGPSSFITLTYDNEHLPKDGSLHLEDLQRFFKRLRFSLGEQRIKYFACGEYGETTNRPHYHAIVFGYWPEHRVQLPMAGRNEPLFRSRDLEALWTAGHSSLGPVTRANAVYIAKYTLGKYDDNGQLRDFAGKTAPFLTMSRRPGIGQNYAREHARALARFGGVRQRGGSLAAVPRYYEKVLDRHEPNLALGLRRRKQEQAAVAAQRKHDEGAPGPHSREVNAKARLTNNRNAL